jgi:hypothetical protein
VFDKYGLTDEEVYPMTYCDKFGPKFTFCGNYMEGFVDNQSFVACHYAIRVWNSIGKGNICICGHSHNNCLEITKESKTGKILDVSVEGFGGPVVFSEILKIMNSKVTSTEDHHENKTNNKPSDKQSPKPLISKYSFGGINNPFLEEGANYLHAYENQAKILDDGFGSKFSVICEKCGKETMEIVRPGKVQCCNCG